MTEHLACVSNTKRLSWIAHSAIFLAKAPLVTEVVVYIHAGAHIHTEHTRTNTK